MNIDARVRRIHELKLGQLGQRTLDIDRAVTDTFEKPRETRMIPSARTYRCTGMTQRLA